MTKAEFIDEVRATLKDVNLNKKQTEAVVNAVFEALGNAVVKGRFMFPGFGTFVVRERKARKGRNPKTGQIIQIKASKTVAFKPAPKLKSKL